MSIVLVAKTIDQSLNGDAINTSAIDATGANLCFASIGWYNGNSPTMIFHDSQGNTWTHLTDRVNASGHVVSDYYVISPSVSASFTAGLNAAAQMYPTIYLAAFHDSSITPAFDVENGGTGSGITSFQGGSISPSNINNIAFASIAFGDSISGLGINSSYTTPSFINTDGAHNVGLAVSYKIGVGASENPTYSWTGSAHVAMNNADFTSSGAPVGGSVVGSYYERFVAGMGGEF